MDKINHQQKKPINEIMIVLKDIRSEISQIKREILQLKNEINKLNDKETDTRASGWFFT
jgi:predicted nucleotidyltransferase